MHGLEMRHICCMHFSKRHCACRRRRAAGLDESSASASAASEAPAQELRYRECLNSAMLRTPPDSSISTI